MSLNRRNFLKTMSALSAGLVASRIRAEGETSSEPPAAPSKPIKVGLVGCGMRGTGAMENAFRADEGVVLHAMADPFPSAIDRARRTLGKLFAERIQADGREFGGLDGYEKVLASGVDLVILASPPAFRPVHIMAAASKGVHLFAEKPVAVDVAGLRTVIEAARIAREKNASFLTGLCWRFDPRKASWYAECLGPDGIGPVRSFAGTFSIGGINPPSPAPDHRRALSWQLRNWYNFRWLSGGVAVEQAIHTIDKMLWAFGGRMPESCIATGGRVAPQHGGADVLDNISGMFFWKDGVQASVMSRRVDGTFMENADYLVGERGHGRSDWTSAWLQVGEKRRRIKESGDMYQVEMDQLLQALRADVRMDNSREAIDANTAALMMQLSAETGARVTRDFIVNESRNRTTPDFATLTLDTEVPLSPLPVPGKTRLD